MGHHKDQHTGYYSVQGAWGSGADSDKVFAIPIQQGFDAHTRTQQARLHIIQQGLGLESEAWVNPTSDAESSLMLTCSLPVSEALALVSSFERPPKSVGHQQTSTSGPSGESNTPNRA